MSDYFINLDQNFGDLDKGMPQDAFMEYNEDTYDVLGSVFLREMNEKVSQTGEMRVAENECRFDNLSHAMFQTPGLWWFVMEYNDYIDWDVKSTKILKIPDFGEIFELKDTMISRQNLANIRKVKQSFL